MNPRNIKVIFFDLDNTLFDHSRAERSALLAVIHRHPKLLAVIDEEMFLTTYARINQMLWKKLAAGELSAERLKTMRFELTLDELDANHANPAELSDQYFKVYGHQCFEIPGAKEILCYLNPRYQLGILSNGFPDIQENKLRSLDIGSFFMYKIYSAEVGVGKPLPGIFEFAQKAVGVRTDELVYIGNSYEEDVVGANSAGWPAIHFSPRGDVGSDGHANFTIRDLLELKQIF
jgi:putative hydrolase of the HAD superfamily